MDSASTPWSVELSTLAQVLVQLCSYRSCWDPWFGHVPAALAQGTSGAAGIPNSAEGLGQLQTAEVGARDQREVF